MINSKDHHLAWSGLLNELDEAREHLDDLVKEMNAAGAIEDSEFAVYLGHVFAHLNRAWHSRNQDAAVSLEQWPSFSQFPSDLRPVG